MASQKERMEQKLQNTTGNTPANSHLPPAPQVKGEKPKQETDYSDFPSLDGPKKLKSYYANLAVFDALQELARYRSRYTGEKNGRGQDIGAGSLIDIAAAEYLKRNWDELLQWRAYEQSLPKPPTIRKNGGD